VKEYTAILPAGLGWILVKHLAAEGGVPSYKFGDGDYGTLASKIIRSGDIVTVQVTVRAENGITETAGEYIIRVYQPNNTGTVGVNGPGEKITLSPVAPVILSWKGRGQQIYTVSGFEDQSSIRWLVDGQPADSTTNGSATFTVSARNYLLRAYKLTVMAKSGGRLYSQDVVFTITE
jgi:hypothetical protein